MRKKKKYLIWGILVMILSGGTIIGLQHPNLFSKKIYPTKHVSSKGQQLEEVKKHGKEIADFVKSQSPKVDSVQFNWDSMEVGEIGNGTPQGGGYMLTLDGRINNNKDTEFTLGIPLKRDSNEVPEELVIYEMQPIRILRDGGWYYYDE